MSVSCNLWHQKSQVMLGDNPASASKNFSRAGPIYTCDQSQPLYDKPLILWKKTHKSILSLINEGQHLTDRPKNIAHNYLLLFSLVCSPSNILYVHTSALCKSNGSNLTSNQHNPYFRCTVAPPKYHTAVVHAAQLS